MDAAIAPGAILGVVLAAILLAVLISYFAMDKKGLGICRRQISSSKSKITPPSSKGVVMKPSTNNVTDYSRFDFMAQV